MIIRSTYRRHFDEGFMKIRNDAIDLCMSARGLDRMNFDKMLNLFKDKEEIKKLKET